MDVAGVLHGSSNAYFGGKVGVDTTSTGYKLQVHNGVIALFNTMYAKAWVLNYSSSSNYFSLPEGTSARMVVLNGGNVGFGTANPAVKLDVAGSLNVDKNAGIGGSLTVNSNKGVLYNPASSTNLKVFTFTTLKFTCILGGHQLYSESSIGFGNVFVITPKVFVEDEAQSGGTSGTLNRV